MNWIGLEVLFIRTYYENEISNYLLYIMYVYDNSIIFFDIIARWKLLYNNFAIQMFEKSTKNYIHFISTKFEFIDSFMLSFWHLGFKLFSLGAWYVLIEMSIEWNSESEHHSHTSIIRTYRISWLSAVVTNLLFSRHSNRKHAKNEYHSLHFRFISFTKI